LKLSMTASTASGYNGFIVMLQQIAQQQPEMVLDRFVEVTMTQPQLPTLDLIPLHGAMVAH